MTTDNFITETSGGSVIRSWTRGIVIEEEAQAQVRAVSRLPFVKSVSVMPDAHAGKGSTVGTVITCEGAVVPATVGVDIGCGVFFGRTSMTVSDLDDRDRLRAQIEKAIPHGRTANGGRADRGAWGTAPEQNLEFWDGDLRDGYEDLRQEIGDGINHPQVLNQLGTLGTGNHFIELAGDAQDRVWVCIHSGSRGVGARIGTHFMKRARQLMDRYLIKLEDPDLAYLPEGEKEFTQYLRCQAWALSYAWSSRRIMAESVLEIIGGPWQELHDCHHNYVEHRGHTLTIRKGAVCTRGDEPVIIPGSMGVGSYIARAGAGASRSNWSCSHGAGRTMSRTRARGLITMKQHALAMTGISCRQDPDILDESPAAYKDLNQVMVAQSDLVVITDSLKPILNVKG